MRKRVTLLNVTTRQQQALDFIRANQRVAGPKLRELAKHLGCASNAAQQKVKFLRELGLIEENDGRGIVLKAEKKVQEEVAQSRPAFPGPGSGRSVLEQAAKRLGVRLVNEPRAPILKPSATKL